MSWLADLWWRMVERIASGPRAATILARVLHRLDAPLLRLTRGRLRVTVGRPVVLLRTVGARTGLPREVPLLYAQDGNRVILIASNFGQARHPAWYYNLRANPRAELLIDGRWRPYLAREATGEERERLWRKALAVYRGYDAYRLRAQGRTIPVMVLTPLPSTAPDQASPERPSAREEGSP